MGTVASEGFKLSGDGLKPLLRVRTRHRLSVGGGSGNGSVLRGESEGHKRPNLKEVIKDVLNEGQTGGGSGRDSHSWMRSVSSQANRKRTRGSRTLRASATRRAVGRGGDRGRHTRAKHTRGNWLRKSRRRTQRGRRRRNRDTCSGVRRSFLRDSRKDRAMRTRWGGGNRLGVRARTGSHRGRWGTWEDHRRGKHSRRRCNRGWARGRSKNREVGPCELRRRRQRVASVERGGLIKHHNATMSESAA